MAVSCHVCFFYTGTTILLVVIIWEVQQHQFHSSKKCFDISAPTRVWSLFNIMIQNMAFIGWFIMNSHFRKSEMAIVPWPLLCSICTAWLNMITLRNYNALCFHWHIIYFWDVIHHGKIICDRLWKGLLPQRWPAVPIHFWNNALLQSATVLLEWQTAKNESCWLECCWNVRI